MIRILIDDSMIDDGYRLSHLRPQRSCGRTPSAQIEAGMMSDFVVD